MRLSIIPAVMLLMAGAAAAQTYNTVVVPAGFDKLTEVIPSAMEDVLTTSPICVGEGEYDVELIGLEIASSLLACTTRT